MLNESETRAELIDPKLREKGWGVVPDTKVLREYRFTDGQIQMGAKGKPDIADYILVYKNIKLAVIEAKRKGLGAREGVMQAKKYADKLRLPYAYATDGAELYEIALEKGEEGDIEEFPTPAELWKMAHPHEVPWEERFREEDFHRGSGTKQPRYYQEIAVNKVLDRVAHDANRILLTLATGTGKTFIAFQIAWKLFQTRWNTKKDGSRRPRILFLADRNILADQAFNSFGAFSEDALARISTKDIRKKGAVPMNASIFFTIFQTFMSGPEDTPYYGEYPKDFFDFIIIDECHRGGANDEGNWRGILEYFSPAVQLGLTATPKRKDNVDTYRYFGEPVYSYSLKEGISDGFLTPFKIKRIKTTLDDYLYTSDDQIIEGELEEGKLYEERDFNKTIEIKEREEYRVKLFLSEIQHHEKTLVFCATQSHAALVRDLINQQVKHTNPFYCVRVTAQDGEQGEQYLREFQDNEKTIPTILTTSQKLSTGVDARNVRNIVLMRPVNSMIEFKQIVGRGTRLFEGKTYFTIYDFVDAYKHFADPEWDGEPLEEAEERLEEMPTLVKEPLAPYKSQSPEGEENPPRKILKIKLRDGKSREIKHMISTAFFAGDGTPMSVEEFMQNLYGVLPDFFMNEEELRKEWAYPQTRKVLLDKLGELGYGVEQLEELQKLIDAEKSDIFDVLAYIAFAIKPISREERAKHVKGLIISGVDEKQKEFLEFVLGKYVEEGVRQLDEDKLPQLLQLKYHTVSDATERLGQVGDIRNAFFELQKELYLR